MGPSTRLSTEHIFGKSFADFPLFFGQNFPFPLNSTRSNSNPSQSHVTHLFQTWENLLCLTKVYFVKLQYLDKLG